MFEEESGTPAGIDLDSITDRMEIRRCVQTGEVEAAIDRVNDLNPEVKPTKKFCFCDLFVQILEEHSELFFHMQQQRLIELIRQGKTEEALEFAQEYLAPHGEENPKYLEELERTVALLAFEDIQTSPVADLMDVTQRQKTASELNAAILSSQCQEEEPRLPHLLKMMIWAQNRLKKKIASFPVIEDLVSAKLKVADKPTGSS